VITNLSEVVCLVFIRSCDAVPYCMTFSIELVLTAD
jgi:hypothetical protein